MYSSMYCASIIDVRVLLCRIFEMVTWFVIPVLNYRFPIVTGMIIPDRNVSLLIYRVTDFILPTGFPVPTPIPELKMQ